MIIEVAVSIDAPPFWTMDLTVLLNELAQQANVLIFVRSFFLLAATTVLFIFALPHSTRFLIYGARATEKSDPPSNSGNFNLWLDWVASITVPHSWFIHFYLFSAFSLSFWAYKWTTQYSDIPLDAQTVAVFTLFSVHVVRRFIEQFFAPPSSSRMSVLHWIMGLLFYMFMSVAIWIEWYCKFS
jgi:3-oxo-5-alpha-steroid 4-dehydrogenase 3